MVTPEPPQLVPRHRDQRRAISSVPCVTCWHLPEVPTYGITNIIKRQLYTATLEVIGSVTKDD